MLQLITHNETSHGLKEKLQYSFQELPTISASTHDEVQINSTFFSLAPKLIPGVSFSTIIQVIPLGPATSTEEQSKCCNYSSICYNIS